MTAAPPSELAMMITRGRTVYRGLLGQPRQRTLGGLSIYATAGDPFSIRIGDAPVQNSRIVLVPPNVPVTISAPERLIDLILIEPEFVPVGSSRRALDAACVDGSAAHRRLLGAFSEWSRQSQLLDCTDSAVDRYFFGRDLLPRRIDPRIAAAAALIAANSGDKHAAADHAAACGLSFSRFVHLFRDEVGMTFRSFCAWKRARAMLAYVTKGSSLTEVALQIGYPDSTHFSHSIRRIYGLRPRDIFSGSRRLAVHTESSPQA
ncbi:MAG: helix-turn-helix domain-containing protein [Haliea sp.]